MIVISPYSLTAIAPTVLLPLSLLLSLSLPPFRFRGILCSILIISLVYLTFTSPFPPSSPNTQARYGLFAIWFYYLPVLHKLLFTIPEESFWRIHHDEKGRITSEKEGLQLKGWAKIKWAAALVSS